MTTDAFLYFSTKDKRDAAEREVMLRVRVYDRLVHEGKMTRETAARQIAVMRAIADDYRRAAEKEGEQ